MRVRVVLGEDARAIINGKDENGRHAEEGEGPRHGCGGVWPRGGFGTGTESPGADKVSSPPLRRTRLIRLMRGR